MKWLKSNLVQNTFAIWAMLMMCLVAFRITEPNDPWVHMVTQPIILIFGPLLLAGVWLFATWPAPCIIDDDGTDPLTHEKHLLRMALLRRMARIWMIAFVVFAIPHPKYRGGVFDPLFHNPTFLIIAPLALAAIPWISYKE
jgi:hypothetical protein